MISDKLKKEIIDMFTDIETFGDLQMQKEDLTIKMPDISFIINDESQIVNPFLDEWGEDEVNPITYYKEEFLNSDFIKRYDEIKKFLDNL